MNALEMHISFKQGLDKFDSKNYPNLLPEEIDLILNQSQEMFIKQRYGMSNLKGQGFEVTQKRTEDLRTLVKTETLIPGSNSNLNININSIFVDFPQDYWIMIQELANISYQDCNGNTITDNVKIYPIQHDNYSNVIDNPFKKPTDNRVLRLITKEGIELLHSSTSNINSYKLRYIKNPIKIDSRVTPTIDCELPEITHQEIVNIAISIALENIEAARLKTYIQVTENRQE